MRLLIKVLDTMEKFVRDVQRKTTTNGLEENAYAGDGLQRILQACKKRLQPTSQY